ncbi:MAG: hypothetical protein GY757_59650, partial [bacterium]|nr:hypothetical protein [bacterium]
GWLIPFKNGETGYAEPLIRLMEYIDRSLLDKFQARGRYTHREYSSLMPVARLDQMEYTSELLSNFWFMNTKTAETQNNLALQTAPCFKIYFELENRELEKDMAYTLIGKCFRHEKGRTFFFETLTNVRRRELVFVGSKDHVLKGKDEAVTLTLEWMEELGMAGVYCTADDPFFISTAKRKELDIPCHVKYEFRCDIPGRQKDISIGSFDVHGNFFSSVLNITAADASTVWSGCMGYGIERCAWAFLQQKGLDTNRWPEAVRNAVTG